MIKDSNLTGNDSLIITNGCSFVAGHDGEKFPNRILARVLGNKMSSDFVSLAKSCNSNDAIFRTTFNYLTSNDFLNKEHEYKKTYLIIGLSDYGRLEFYNDTENTYLQYSLATASASSNIGTFESDFKFIETENKLLSNHLKNSLTPVPELSLHEFMLVYELVLNKYKVHMHRNVREMVLLNSYCIQNNINLLFFNALHGIDVKDIPTGINFYKKFSFYEHFASWKESLTPDTLIPDDGHPNELGVDIMSDELIEYMNKLNRK
jgi:hypothetical protein